MQGEGNTGFKPSFVQILLSHKQLILQYYTSNTNTSIVVCLLKSFLFLLFDWFVLAWVVCLFVLCVLIFTVPVSTCCSPYFFCGTGEL